jgi:hypothetical protein
MSIFETRGKEKRQDGNRGNKVHAVTKQNIGGQAVVRTSIGEEDMICITT